MRPRLIILVRHGQSEANVDISIHRTVPDHKIKLTQLGVEQAIKAGSRLNELLKPEDTVQFYVSPYLRTRQTFEYMSKALDKGRWRYYEEPRLREQGEELRYSSIIIAFNFIDLIISYRLGKFSRTAKGNGKDQNGKGILRSFVSIFYNFISYLVIS
jgi:hypothetical protein